MRGGHYVVGVMQQAPDARNAPYAGYGCPDPEWLRIDWRDHRRRVALRGAEVECVEMGEGPPLVLVHGLGGCWQNWLENIPALARRHRVIAFDLPGFGASPMPEREISIASYGRILSELCDRLDLGPETAVAGNSMGGFIATEAAIEHPGRFSALVLVGAAGISFARARHQPAKVLAAITNLARPVLAAFGDDAVRRPRLRRAAFAGVVHRPDLLRREMLWELTQGGLGPPAFGEALVSMMGYDARERLSEIAIPTLIVWGFNDRLVPVRAALSYRRRIPGSRLEILDRTGHVPMVERPAEFNGMVEEFLSR